jgi:hypothetical protein
VIKVELKTNYQYTYFIYPFVVDEEKYVKYLLKSLKDKNCRLKIFDKDKDLKLYKYFAPKIRDFIFSGFEFTKEKINSLMELPQDTRAAVLAKNDCTIFEYNLKSDIQGKTEVESGIFFKIQKIEIICFNTGICFLAIKTNVEDLEKFSEVLNFNYKFRDIRQQSSLDNYENIRLQTDSFSDVRKFTELIENITGSNFANQKLGIDTERFLSYSYVCIDQSYWNRDKGFENLEYDFTKFASVLPADYNANINAIGITSFQKWKYAKIGITKQGVFLFASDCDINNYTILPDEFEYQYFYTYLLSVYKKLYLKKVAMEVEQGKNVRKILKKFIKFTKKIWVEDITFDEVGSLLENKFSEVLDLDKFYGKMKNEYDIMYKELNIEKNIRLSISVAIVFALALFVNVLIFLKF